MIRFLIDPENMMLDYQIGRLLKYLGDQAKCLPYGSDLSGDSGRIYLTPVSKPQNWYTKFRSDTRVINGIKLQHLVISKYKTSQYLGKRGVLMPPAVMTKSFEDWDRFASQGIPGIYKMPDECGGSGHFIVHPSRGLAYSGNQIYRLAVSDGLIVPHISRVPEGDLPEVILPANGAHVEVFLFPDDMRVWRVYVVGGKPCFLSARTRDSFRGPGDYIINVARGARYELYDLAQSHRLVVAAEKVLTHLKIEVGAIDLLIHQNEVYVLEVDVDGLFIGICRGFYESPSYRSRFDLDRLITDHLLAV